jgi:hypothetical protein
MSRSSTLTKPAPSRMGLSQAVAVRHRAFFLSHRCGDRAADHEEGRVLVIGPPHDIADAPAGFEHPQRFACSRHFVFGKHQAEPAGYAVEGVVFERQCRHVGRGEAHHVEPDIDRSLTRLGQHFRGQVAGGDSTAVAECQADADRRIACAGAEIEHPFAGCDAGKLYQHLGQRIVCRQALGGGGGPAAAAAFPVIAADLVLVFHQIFLPPSRSAKSKYSSRARVATGPIW